MEEKYIVALEIGSSKIKGAVGSVDFQGALTVLAVEEERMTDIVRYGCIRNVGEVANRVSAIVRKLENRISPRKIESVYVAIGGRTLCTSQREVERQLPEEAEITARLIEELKHEALSAAFSDRDVVAVVPREFSIDRKTAIQPIGEYGQNIHADVNLVTCDPKLRRNLEHALSNKLSLKINDYIVRQLAQADFVLTPEEKRLGCMFVDFGAETTTVSIYRAGRLQYMSTLPMGSRNITRDIMSLNYLEEAAEERKRVGGNAQPSEDNNANIDGLDFSEINAYVSSRAAEIVLNIKEQLKYANLTINELPAGIIIAGGGSRLKGFNERLYAMTKMKVRLATPVSHVRIADGRISPGDSMDILSVLNEVARLNPAECTIAPEPVHTLEDVPDEPEPEYEPEPDPANRKPSWYNRFKTKIVKLVGDPEEDDDDDQDLRDDD